MSDQTVEQQLADALAENEQLRAKNEELTTLLPPDLGPGLVFRVGRRCPENVYVSDGPGVDGFELGKMPTAAYAAHVVRALNAIQFGTGTVAAELAVKAAALRSFSKQILDGPADLLMRPSIIAELALDAAADYEFEAIELTEGAL